MSAGRSARSTPDRSRLCPSADPSWPDARLIGVVGGTVAEPRIDYVEPRPVTDELLALAHPVLPTEVFRFAGTCLEGGCRHFKSGRCGVAAAVVDKLLAEDAELPRCTIRPDCRWWADLGPSACRRCAMVVTDDPARPKALEDALRPG